jgi:hypothetical protein
VEDDGTPMAAIVAADDLYRLRHLEEESDRATIVDDGRRDIRGPQDKHGRTFWESVSLESLAAEQGVQPMQDVEQLAGDFWPEDEGPEDFVTWLRHQRRLG